MSQILCGYLEASPSLSNQSTPEADQSRERSSDKQASEGIGKVIHWHYKD
jgi:hypothetical protein